MELKEEISQKLFRSYREREAGINNIAKNLTLLSLPPEYVWN
jgi:hypothetical protein